MRTGGPGTCWTAARRLRRKERCHTGCGPPPRAPGAPPPPPPPSSICRRPASEVPTPASSLQRLGGLHGADDAPPAARTRPSSRSASSSKAGRAGTRRRSTGESAARGRTPIPGRRSGSPRRHQRLAVRDAGAVDRVPGREVVAAVEHHVGLPAPARPAAARRRARTSGVHLHVGVDGARWPARAESALGWPMRARLCAIWRCRLVRSTCRGRRS